MGRVLNFKIPTYDDIMIGNSWLSEYGCHVADDQSIPLSIVPERKIITVDVVGRDGSTFVGSKLAPRTLKLPMFIEDIDELDSLKRLLMFNGEQWFTFSNTGRKLKASIVNEIIVKPYGRHGLFYLELYATNPYYYESEPVANAIENPSTIQFYNSGNEVSNPIYTVTGKGIVNISVDGEVITLRMNPDVYEEIEVNCKTYETRSGSFNRLFDNVNDTFPLLQVGINSIAVTGDCTRLVIQANPMWL